MDFVSSTVSLIDVSVRLVKFLKEVNDDRKTIDKEIQSLLRDVTAIKAVTVAIKETFENDLPKETSDGQEGNSESTDLWQNVSRTISDCEKVMLGLEGVIKEIHGKVGPQASSPVDTLGKLRRKRSKEPELHRYRERLAMFQSFLNSFVTAITL
jgi:hypothetical protein